MASTGNNPYEVELLTVQYTTALELLLQLKISKLRGRINSGTHVGKQASPIQQIGVLEYRQPAGRYAPLVPQEPNYTSFAASSIPRVGSPWPRMPLVTVSSTI
jgi:hypothetical protein